MNNITQFRKTTLSNKELIEKIDKLTDKMFNTQKVPIIHIPVRPNEDYDILIGELLIRFNELIKNNK